MQSYAVRPGEFAVTNAGKAHRFGQASGARLGA